MANYKRRPAKGYHTKVFMKLAKRVHANAKKNGEKPSWNDSQKFASQYLYADYRGEWVSHIKPTEVDRIIVRVRNEKAKDVDVFEAEDAEECGSVWKVPQADIISIDWWDLQNVLPMIPGDVNIRVNGGDEFGYTDIKHASLLPYYDGGVNKIVEAIRKAVEGKSGPSWNGVPKVRPGRNDDGQNCSYFLDFVLEIDGSDARIFSSQGESEAAAAFEPLDDEDLEKRKLTKKEVEKEKKQRDKERQEQRASREKMDKAKKRKRPKEQPKEKPEQALPDFAAMLETNFQEWKAGAIELKEYRTTRAKLMNLIDKLNK